MIRYDPYTDRFVDTDKATEVITTDRTICENPYFGKVQQSGTMWKPKPQTNADRIRAMSDEELADKVMCYIRCDGCKEAFHIDCDVLKTCRGIWLEWLKKEVDG